MSIKIVVLHIIYAKLNMYKLNLIINKIILNIRQNGSPKCHITVQKIKISYEIMRLTCHINTETFQYKRRLTFNMKHQYQLNFCTFFLCQNKTKC